MELSPEKGRCILVVNKRCIALRPVPLPHALLGTTGASIRTLQPIRTGLRQNVEAASALDLPTKLTILGRRTWPTYQEPIHLCVAKIVIVYGAFHYIPSFRAPIPTASCF